MNRRLVSFRLSPDAFRGLRLLAREYDLSQARTLHLVLEELDEEIRSSGLDISEVEGLEGDAPPTRPCSFALAPAALAALRRVKSHWSGEPSTRVIRAGVLWTLSRKRGKDRPPRLRLT